MARLLAGVQPKISWYNNTHIAEHLEISGKTVLPQTTGYLGDKANPRLSGAIVRPGIP